MSNMEEEQGKREICYRALAWQALADGKNHLIRYHFKNHARVHWKKVEEQKKGTVAPAPVS